MMVTTEDICNVCAMLQNQKIERVLLSKYSQTTLSYIFFYLKQMAIIAFSQKKQPHFWPQIKWLSTDIPTWHT